jgi:hypothetical protein
MPLLDPRSGPSYGAIEQRDQNGNMDDERDQLLQNGYETEGELSRVETPDEAQEGVLKIEAINMTWTSRSLMIAYVRFVCGLQRGFARFYHTLLFFQANLAQSIFLMAFCTSLEGQTVMSLSAYATSAFSKHSLISTVLVVQNVVNGEFHCGVANAQGK